MATITLPPDLASRIAEAARKRGTTLEEYAIGSLLRLFPPPPVPQPEKTEGSLLDFLGGFVGCVEGTGEPVAREHSEYFTEYLLEKKRQGRL
jgi:hypothetical protein